MRGREAEVARGALRDGSESALRVRPMCSRAYPSSRGEAEKVLAAHGSSPREHLRTARMGPSARHTPGPFPLSARRGPARRPRLPASAPGLSGGPVRAVRSAVAASVPGRRTTVTGETPVPGGKCASTASYSRRASVLVGSCRASPMLIRIPVTGSAGTSRAGTTTARTARGRRAAKRASRAKSRPSSPSGRTSAGAIRPPNRVSSAGSRVSAASMSTTTTAATARPMLRRKVRGDLPPPQSHGVETRPVPLQGAPLGQRPPPAGARWSGSARPGGRCRSGRARVLLVERGEHGRQPVGRGGDVPARAGRGRARARGSGERMSRRGRLPARGGASSRAAGGLPGTVAGRRPGQRVRVRRAPERGWCGRPGAGPDVP